MTTIKKTPSNEAVRQTTKSDFLTALRGACFGNISVACEKVGRSRQTLNQWRHQDSEFNDSVRSAIVQGKEQIADLAEDALKKKIEQGDTTAIIFTLKSLRRGYYGEFREYEEYKRSQSEPSGPFLPPKNMHEALLQFNVLLGHAYYTATKAGSLTEQQEVAYKTLVKSLKE